MILHIWPEEPPAEVYISVWCNIGFEVYWWGCGRSLSSKKWISPLLEPSGRFLWRLVSPSWSTPLSPRGREKKKELEWTDLPKTAGGVHVGSCCGPCQALWGMMQMVHRVCHGEGISGLPVVSAKTGVWQGEMEANFQWCVHGLF